jgi:hypothetical protein
LAISKHLGQSFERHVVQCNQILIINLINAFKSLILLEAYLPKLGHDEIRFFFQAYSISQKPLIFPRGNMITATKKA